MSSQTPATIDPDRLNALLGQAIIEFGATVNAALAVIGDRLGLYRALAQDGPLTHAELAERTGTAERYVREWLGAQAASGYVDYNPDNGGYALSPSRQRRLRTSRARRSSAAASRWRSAQPLASSGSRTRSSPGRAWGGTSTATTCSRAAGAFSNPGIGRTCSTRGFPRSTGVHERLQAGGRVADVGCGHGASAIIMAQGYPSATVVGFDYHADSIAQARERAEQSGLGDRLRFEVSAADEFPGTGYDLITCFDCLHDMGDPVAVARHVRQALADDGTWMIVEPKAGDRVEDNLNPVGRAYYAFSTMLCTPNSLAQGGALALGAQAGQARLREAVTAGGFTRFRQAAETPFNLVLETRQ
jgi:2-polyprenyl-3-methyl-5-hydroxy-6-metoxy-1,4-benzoquinol methylase